MSLSAPADMDEPTDTETVESSPNPSGSDGEDEDVDESADQPAEETMVEIDGEEIPLAEAVERNREVVNNPGRHGIVTGSAFDGLAKLIGDLEDETDTLYGMDGQQQQQIDELKEKVDHIVRILPGVDGTTWEHFDESDGESE